MLEHFIQRKGKGGWVVVMPMLIAAILFIVFSVAEWNDRYVGAASITISAFILWFLDNGPSIIHREGNYKDKQGKNVFMWIDVKYWAIILGITGAAWLGCLLS